MGDRRAAPGDTRDAGRERLVTHLVGTRELHTAHAATGLELSGVGGRTAAGRRSTRPRTARGRDSASRSLFLVAWDVLVALGLAAATAGLAGGPLSGRWTGAAVQPLDATVLLMAVLAPVAIALGGGYDRRRRAAESAFFYLGRFAVGAVVCAWTAWLVAAAAGWPLDLTQLTVVTAILPLTWLGMRGALDARAVRRHPERVLLLGSGKVAHQIVTLTQRHRERGLEIVGRLDDLPLPMGPDGPPLLGSLGDLARVLGSERIDRVIVAFSPRNDMQIVEMLRECDRYGVDVDAVPRFFDLMGPEPRQYSLGGIALLGVGGRRRALVQRTLKRTIDICVSGFLLALAAPVLAATAAAILLDDRGPVLFRQERVGRGGRVFRILKFRTMRQAEAEREPDLLASAEEMEGLVAALKRQGAVRTTRVGRLLRRTSLDELPQLWNVLMGQMSLVGPRPLRPFESDVLAGWQKLRQEVRPGITGLWQILGRSDVAWDERTQLDYSYVRHWTVGNDLRIMARTLPAVFRARGAV